jgi:hypothetical protein
MEFRRTAFGLGEFDDSHPEKAIITFEYMKGMATLRYSAWGVGESGEVVIKLNGTQIDSVPLTQEYRHEILVELPREHLREGVNELEFDSLRNPPEEDPWEVAYVRIVQEPLLPSNPDEALNQHYLGLRLYEDRELDPANGHDEPHHGRAAGYLRARTLQRRARLPIRGLRGRAAILGEDIAVFSRS